MEATNEIHLFRSLLVATLFTGTLAVRYIYPTTSIQAEECVNGTMEQLMESYRKDPKAAAERCACKARPTIVNVPYVPGSKATTLPKYVPVLRCSGSCVGTEYGECMPVSVVKRPVPGVKAESMRHVLYSIDSHENGCSCRCSWTQNSCFKHGGVLTGSCACVRQSVSPSSTCLSWRSILVIRIIRHLIVYLTMILIYAIYINRRYCFKCCFKGQESCSSSLHCFRNSKNRQNTSVEMSEA